jgi:hypothetical protein
MKLRYKALMIIMVVVSVLKTDNARACVTTIINDKAGRIIIYNKEDKSLNIIGKNEKRRFGNQHTRLNFAIYMQQPKKQIFTRFYTCKQNKCAENGNIQLKLSDIENGTGAAELFLIIKNAPYASMVQELSMVKNLCQSCDEE